MIHRPLDNKLDLHHSLKVRDSNDECFPSPTTIMMESSEPQPSSDYKNNNTFKNTIKNYQFPSRTQYNHKEIQVDSPHHGSFYDSHQFENSYSEGSDGNISSFNNANHHHHPSHHHHHHHQRYHHRNINHKNKLFHKENQQYFSGPTSTISSLSQQDEKYHKKYFSMIRNSQFLDEIPMFINQRVDQNDICPPPLRSVLPTTQQDDDYHHRPYYEPKPPPHPHYQNHQNHQNYQNHQNQNILNRKVFNQQNNFHDFNQEVHPDSYYSSKKVKYDNNTFSSAINEIQGGVCSSVPPLLLSESSSPSSALNHHHLIQKDNHHIRNTTPQQGQDSCSESVTEEAQAVSVLLSLSS